MSRPMCVCTVISYEDCHFPIEKYSHWAFDCFMYCGLTVPQKLLGLDLL